MQNWIVLRRGKRHEVCGRWVWILVFKGQAVEGHHEIYRKNGTDVGEEPGKNVTKEKKTQFPEG